MQFYFAYTVRCSQVIVFIGRRAEEEMTHGTLLFPRSRVTGAAMTIVASYVAEKLPADNTFVPFCCDSVVRLSVDNRTVIIALLVP